MTAEQITAEIANLETRLNELPRFTTGGDDNHAAITGQIQVLREPERITNDVIAELCESLPFYTTDAMVRAREWLDGEFEPRDHELDETEMLTALSDEWKPVEPTNSAE